MASPPQYINESPTPPHPLRSSCATGDELRWALRWAKRFLLLPPSDAPSHSHGYGSALQPSAVGILRRDRHGTCGALICGKPATPPPPRPIPKRVKTHAHFRSNNAKGRAAEGTLGSSRAQRGPSAGSPPPPPKGPGQGTSTVRRASHASQSGRAAAQRVHRAHATRQYSVPHPEAGTARQTAPRGPRSRDI